MIPNLNPEQIVHAAGEQVIVELKRRMELCAEYMASITLAGLYVEDRAVGGLVFADDLRQRLLSRAQTSITRAIRTETDQRRRVTDAVYRVDPLFLVVLSNADKATQLIPIGRIIEGLRQEIYSASTVAGTPYRRDVMVGTAVWSPRQGFAKPEALIGKVIEAVMMAALSPMPNGYERLGLAESSLDQLKLYEYPWDEATDKIADTPPPAPAPVPVVERQVAAAPKRPKPQPTPDSGEIKVYSEDKKPIWQFWKR